MSGSIKYFSYTTDGGDLFAISADESNIENVVADDASVDVTVANVAQHQYKLPRNIKPRFATFKSTTTVKTRRIIIPTVAIYNDLATATNLLAVRTFTDADLGETFQLQSLTPERISPVVVDGDTGLSDGDGT